MLHEPACRDEILNHVECYLERLGLTTPARLLLEAHRPLAFLFGQALRVASPLIGGERVGGYADFLEDPSSVEALIRRLEQASSGSS